MAKIRVLEFNVVWGKKTMKKNRCFRWGVKPRATPVLKERNLQNQKPPRILMKGNEASLNQVHCWLLESILPEENASISYKQPCEKKERWNKQSSCCFECIAHKERRRRSPACKCCRYFLSREGGRLSCSFRGSSYNARFVPYQPNLRSNESTSINHIYHYLSCEICFK